MATIVGDKVKLSNYTYQLSLDGTQIEDGTTTNGTRGAIEKVVDAFDIDWRPYKISYTLGTTPYTYELTHSSQIVDSIGTLYSYALLGSTYEGHYMPFDLQGRCASRGTGDYIEDDQSFITSITADGKGHITNVTKLGFRTLPGIENHTSPTSGLKHTMTYLTGVHLREGQLSYSYSSINFTNYGSTLGNEYAKPKFIISNVAISSDGNFTYTYVDSTVTEGSYTGDNLLVSTSTINNGEDCPIVITGITQNAYGVISYTYSRIHAETAGSINSSLADDFVINVMIGPDGNLTGDSGKFTWSNDGSDTGGNLSYLTGVNIDHTGKVSYKYADVNHTCQGKASDDIALQYTYTNTELTKVLTGLSITKSGEISYTYSALRVTNSDTAGTLTYLNTVEHHYSDQPDCVITSMYLDTNDGNKLTQSKVNLAMLPENATNSGSTTLTNATDITVVTGVNQQGNGKVTYTYNKINTTHTNTGVELNAADSHVVTNVHLDANGNYTYTYRDISVNIGSCANSSHTVSYSTPIEVITGITQSADGQITYTYTNIRTDFNVTVVNNDNGDFINEVNYSREGSVSFIKGNFGANPGTVDDKNANTYIVGINIDKNGKATYTYGHITHTNTKSANAQDATLTATYFDVLTNIHLDNEGNFSYQYTPINIGNAKEAETLTYLEHDTVVWDSPLPSVINVYKRDTDDRVTVTTVDLKTGASGNGDSVHSSDVTITNSTKAKVIDNIYQLSNGKVTYTYNYINTTHSFASDGTAQDRVLTNVNITADGLLSYNVTDLTVTNGVDATWANYSTTDAVEKMPLLLTSAKRVLTGITQSGNGKISYTYTSIYTDPVNDYRYHELNIASTSAKLEEYNTGDYVEAITGISTINGNGVSHDISYETSRVATMAYVTMAFKKNDAMRYCGTFNVDASGNLVLTHTATGSAHTFAGNPDISTGAMYKSTYHGVINGIMVQVGDQIIATGSGTSATNISQGWDIFQGNLNIQSSGTNSVNTAQAARLVSNIYIDDAGLLTYTYNDISTSVVDGITTVITSAEGSSSNINSSSTTGSTTTGTFVVTGVNLTNTGTDMQLTYNVSKIFADTHHHATTYEALNNDQGRVNPKFVSGVHLDYDGTLTYAYSTLNISANHYVTSAAWFNEAADDKTTITTYGATYTNANVNPPVVVPSDGLGVSSAQIIGNINVDNLGHVTYVGTTQILHGQISATDDIYYHGTVNATQAVNDSTYTFVTGGTRVVSGFGTNTTGHVTNIVSTVITDENIKTTAIPDNNKVYLVGVSTPVGTANGLTHAQTYITNNDTLHTQNIVIDGNAEIGASAASTTTIKSKNIIIDNSNNTLVSFENLNLLWGNLT